MLRKTLLNGARRFSTSVKDTDVVVVSFARTPITKMGGALSSMTAPQVITDNISQPDVLFSS